MKDHIWNPKAYDYSSKQIINADGTISYEKVGAWVLTDEACAKIMNMKREVLAKENYWGSDLKGNNGDLYRELQVTGDIRKVIKLMVDNYGKKKPIPHTFEGDTVTFLIPIYDNQTIYIEFIKLKEGFKAYPEVEE